MSNKDTIKDQTTVPEWGTLAGELPKGFTDQMGEDLKEALHARECGPEPDIEAIYWAHGLISANWDLIYGTRTPRPAALQMLHRLAAMLPEKRNTHPECDARQ